MGDSLQLKATSALGNVSICRALGWLLAIGFTLFSCLVFLCSGLDGPSSAWTGSILETAKLITHNLVMSPGSSPHHKDSSGPRNFSETAKPIIVHGITMPPTQYQNDSNAPTEQQGNEDVLSFLADLPPIPKLIHLSWKEKEGLLESNLDIILNGVRNLVDLNPGWKVEVSNDTDVDAYLKEKLDPSDYEALSWKHIVEKTDLWRLLKLYHEGGVYSDIERPVNLPLSRWINGSEGKDVKVLLPVHRMGDFSQDFMCSSPGNPMFKSAIEENLKCNRANKGTLACGPLAYVQAMANYLVPHTERLKGTVMADQQGKPLVPKQAFMEITWDKRARPFIMGQLMQVITSSKYARTFPEQDGNNILFTTNSSLAAVGHRKGMPGGKRALYRQAHVVHWKYGVYMVRQLRNNSTNHMGNATG